MAGIWLNPGELIHELFEITGFKTGEERDEGPVAGTGRQILKNGG